TDEVELFVTVSGVDDTSLQPVHGRQKYTDGGIVWGARHADVLSEDAEGRLILDLRRFHELTPTAPTPDFPYPVDDGGSAPSHDGGSAPNPPPGGDGALPPSPAGDGGGSAPVPP